jgi:hypothetical protein
MPKRERAENVVNQLPQALRFMRAVNDVSYEVTGYRFTPGLVHLFGLTSGPQCEFFNDDHHMLDRQALLDAGIPPNIVKLIVKTAKTVKFTLQRAPALV